MPDRPPPARPPIPRRGRRLLVRAAPSLLLVVVFLLGFLGRPEDRYWLNRSHLWGPGDPFYEEADERFVAHSTMIWRGRPSHAGKTRYEHAGIENAFRHNALGLRDEELVTPKPQGMVRVLTLGDSATWGLNLRDVSESYPDRLETLLRERDGAEAWDVVNGGTIGYSSLQGVRFLQCRLDEIDPDVVTIFLGNNDFQSSGAKDLARSPREPSAVARWLEGNFFYLLARKGLLALQAGDFEERAAEFMEMTASRDRTYYRTKELYYEGLARVTPAQYEQNLRAMIELCRARGTRVILLDVPMNLLWPLAVRPAFPGAFPRRGYWRPVYVRRNYLADAFSGGEPGADAFPGHPYLTLATPERVREHFAPSGDPVETLLDSWRATVRAGGGGEAGVLARHNLGIWEMLNGEFERATASLATAARAANAPGSPILPGVRAQLLLDHGLCLLLSGKRDEAFDRLRDARGAFPFAMNPDYETRFDAVVEELDVEWIDLPARFAGCNPEHGGSALFSDWVHPNPEGCRVIAEAIAEVL